MVNIIIDFLKNAERKRHTEEITFDKLIMMSENIASGMSELVRLGIVHRDLAARNVMVDKWLQVSTNQHLMKFSYTRNYFSQPEKFYLHII